jgi:hypothetical protein
MASKIFNIIIIAAALFSFMQFSCSVQGEEETIVPFEVIHGGAYSSIADKRQVVVTNQEEYMKLMDELYSYLDQVPKVPEVDFTKNSVVAVFMGEKPNGGYTINFDKVIKRKDDLTVSFYETTPGPKCMVTDAITRPYEIAKIPKIDRKVKFKTKTRVNECQ